MVIAVLAAASARERPAVVAAGAVVAAPLFVVALWFDMRSLSRHLVPEVVGSVAIASVASPWARWPEAPPGRWPSALG